MLPDFAGCTPERPASLDDCSDELSLEDWAALAQAKESQQSCNRRFLKLEDGGQITAPRLYRRATHKILRALDHALVLCTGRGLEAWCQGKMG